MDDSGYFLFICPICEKLLRKHTLDEVKECMAQAIRKETDSGAGPVPGGSS